MIFDLIDLIAQLLGFLVALTIAVLTFGFFLKNYPKKNKMKFQKIGDDLFSITKKVWIWVGFTIGITIKFIIAGVIGIISEEYIFLLNSPLGHSYSLWASYVLAIGVFIILPNFFDFRKKEAKGDV